ncbi:uncharacterized protein TrAFT101_005523 [Trichoderma asperellum]|uniref:uncharacterized protein n=1 Tax=Trichoderma asperellum TaxID=101201 RepID=UPI0033180442|nr:hypothetical protein TrAFT101_005523 [Trichoderma asperellum]
MPCGILLAVLFRYCYCSVHIIGSSRSVCAGPGNLYKHVLSEQLCHSSISRPTRRCDNQNQQQGHEASRGGFDRPKAQSTPFAPQAAAAVARLRSRPVLNDREM